MKKVKHTRTVNIENYLTEALIILLQSKEFDRISISELCAKAGVSRMSFYRNFKNKNDILVFLLDRQFQAFLENLSDKRDLSVLCRAYFDHFSPQKNLIRHLLRSQKIMTLVDRFDEFLDLFLQDVGRVHGWSDEERRVRNHFINGGIVKLTIAWVQGEVPDDPGFLARVVESILLCPLKNLSSS